MTRRSDIANRAGAFGLRAVFSVLPALASFAVAAETCAPYVESAPQWRTAMLRPHSDAFVDCVVSEATYVALVRDWLSHERDADTAPASFGLGRLVLYPWLSSAIAQGAAGHPDWDRRRGRGRETDANAFVEALLSSPAVLGRLGEPFEGSSYRVSGMSVEKVLVGPASAVLPGFDDPDALLPYDAQVWLTLAPAD